MFRCQQARPYVVEEIELVLQATRHLIQSLLQTLQEDHLGVGASGEKREGEGGEKDEDALEKGL